MILPRLQEIPGEIRVSRILGGIIFPQILVFFFVLGRTISRIWVTGIWGWDDSLIVFAWLNSLAVTVFFGVGTLYGQGHHIEDVPYDLLTDSFSIKYATLICYQLATKLSILAFYLRVFPARREKWLSWGTIIFVVVFTLPILLGDLLLCNPVTIQSFFGGDNTFCFPSPTPFLIASTVLHTLTDAWLILMVIPVVSTLKIPKKQKIALICVLSLGVFVTIASIARIVSIVRISGQTDFTWVVADFDIWSSPTKAGN